VRLIHFAGIALIALVWGSSFLFIAVMLREMSPLAVAWLRLGGGAAVILGFAVFRRPEIPRSKRFWLDVTVLSVLASTLPFILIPLGQREISSGLAAILNSSVPIWAATFAFMLLPTERLSRARAFGLLVGFAGVAVVIGPDALAAGTAGVRGQIEVLLASACYGAGAVYFRRHLAGRDSTFIAGTQSAIGFLLLTPIVLAVGDARGLAHVSAVAILAALGLALLSSGIAIIVYYWLLTEVTAAQATTSTYLLPITAMFWGWSLLGEQVRWTVLPGLVLVLAGVWLINRPAKESRRVLGRLRSQP